MLGLGVDVSPRRLGVDVVFQQHLGRFERAFERDCARVQSDFVDVEAAAPGDAVDRVFHGADEQPGFVVGGVFPDGEAVGIGEGDGGGAFGGVGRGGLVVGVDLGRAGRADRADQRAGRAVVDAQGGALDEALADPADVLDPRAADGEGALVHRPRPEAGAVGRADQAKGPGRGLLIGDRECGAAGGFPFERAAEQAQAALAEIEVAGEAAVGDGGADLDGRAGADDVVGVLNDGEFEGDVAGDLRVGLVQGGGGGGQQPCEHRQGGQHAAPAGEYLRDELHYGSLFHGGFSRGSAPSRAQVDDRNGNHCRGGFGLRQTLDLGLRGGGYCCVGVK